MRTLGAPEEEIEAVRQAQQVDAPPEQPQLFEVYHDNALIVRTFWRCRTQWEHISGGFMKSGTGCIESIRTGLRYEGVDVIVNRFVPQRSQNAVWDGLQIMERSVLATDARLRAQQS